MTRTSMMWSLALALVAGAGLVRAQDDGARFEPNQSRRAAAKIEPGSYAGLVCDREDWYVVPLEAGQRLLVEVSFRHADGDLDVGLYDARGRLCGHSRGTAEVERVAFTADEPAPVFVRVFGETNRYALKLERSALGEMPEAGWELSACGNDWFARQVPAKEAVRARAAAAEGELATVFVRDADGNELANGEAGAVCQVEFAVEEERRVLVQLVARGAKPLRFALTVGRPVPEDLKRVVGKVRPDGAGSDLIELHNGDTLRAEVLTPSFRLEAPYGALSLRREHVAGIDLGTPSRPTQSLVAVDGSQFSGFVRLEALEVRLQGEVLRIPLERVRRVVFGRRGGECDALRPRRMLVLQSDDRFTCALAGIDPGFEPAPPWVLALGFAEQAVELDRLERIEVNSSDEVILRRADGSLLRGRLNREFVELELDFPSAEGQAQRLRVHLSRIAQILPRPSETAGRGNELEFAFDGPELDGWDAMSDGNSSWSRVAEGDSGGCLHAGGANGGNYADNAGIFATSPALPIEGMQAPVLSFRARYQLEDGADFIAVMVSYDGGQTYVELHRLSGTQPWTPMQLALEPRAEVRLRFALISDASVNAPGAWIDDVKISDGAE
ncbi:MAG: hypothetical protein KDD82_20945 [Planctomycetes bacterium]|nr:hypothetical protein [Planctomycetota bacterium]